MGCFLVNEDHIKPTNVTVEVVDYGDGVPTKFIQSQEEYGKIQADTQSSKTISAYVDIWLLIEKEAFSSFDILE